MESLTRCASIHYRVRRWRESGARVALIPTRGTLHRGHMSLVAAAQEMADRVVVSSFADPPRHDALEADRELLRNIGADILFVPPAQEVFPRGRDLAAVVTVPELADQLEGADRPGYLAGQTTLWVKLLHIVGPTMAVFGERDFQLLVMMRLLAADLFLGVDIVGRPTWRDADGLAVASVNRNLAPEHRSIAGGLHSAVEQIARDLDGGARDHSALERRGELLLAASGFSPEYFAIRQSADLAPPRSGARGLVILAAARLGAVRLTDSMPIRVIERH